VSASLFAAATICCIGIGTTVTVDDCDTEAEVEAIGVVNGDDSVRVGRLDEAEVDADADVLDSGVRVSEWLLLVAALFS
jgi:hypothetical protein